MGGHSQTGLRWVEETRERGLAPVPSYLVTLGHPWMVFNWRKASVGPGRTLKRPPASSQVWPPCWPGRCLFPEHHLSQRTFTLAGQAGPEGSSPVPTPAERSHVPLWGCPRRGRCGCSEVSG